MPENLLRTIFLINFVDELLMVMVDDDMMQGIC